MLATVCVFAADPPTDCRFTTSRRSPRVGLTIEQPPEFLRAAVIREQIERYSLPTSPPKKSDKRSVFTDTITVQAEALPPDVLQAEIRAAIEPFIDEAVLAEQRERSKVEHQRLIDEIKEQRGE